ncbi:MAG: YggS family pyridoxal phosphate-dependent enzyme [Planctomycetota bacterium]|jgi:pyridoxal phosphate enzyme (YggS family)
MSTIAERIQAVQRRIEAALARSPHGPRPVTLIAVTKHHPAAVVDEVARAGILDVGENRVQEAVEKAQSVEAPVRWHLIGHLQRNKVNKALTLFDTIHSVDSPRLVTALGTASGPALEAAGRNLDIFLQVNVSGEASKAGVAPEGAAELLRSTQAWPSLRVLGLMTMAPYATDPEEARPHFRALFELQADLNRDLKRDGLSAPLKSLSMGMSGDFEVAIEEGATHVRVGSAITAEIAPHSG